MADHFVIRLPIAGSAITNILIGNSQNQGMRPYQEDSFGFTSLDPEKVLAHGFIATVSDGMGGLSGGDKLSSYSVSSIQRVIDRHTEGVPVHRLFTNALNEINTEIAASDIGGGATFSAVFCTKNGVFWASTGDSRIYLYRNGMMHQLTRDFDYADQLLDKVINGMITFDEADSDPKKDSLAEYIGSGEPLTVDANIKPFIPEIGDKLLICSDGVYNALTEQDFLSQLGKTPQSCADGLTACVLGKRYENQDNFTMIVLEFR